MVFQAQVAMAFLSPRFTRGNGVLGTSFAGLGGRMQHQSSPRSPLEWRALLGINLAPLTGSRT